MTNKEKAKHFAPYVYQPCVAKEFDPGPYENTYDELGSMSYFDLGRLIDGEYDDIKIIAKPLSAMTKEDAIAVANYMNSDGAWWIVQSNKDRLQLANHDTGGALSVDQVNGQWVCYYEDNLTVAVKSGWNLKLA